MKAIAHLPHSVGRRVIAVAVSLAIVFGVGVSPASADELIAFSNDELLIAEPGTLTTLATVAVDPSQVGLLCTLSVASQNQASIHNGNDLIITTGEVETVIADVEAEPDQTTDLSVDIILGPTISVDLRMGPDWVSSLGFGLWLGCGAEEPVLATGQPVHCPDAQGSLPDVAPTVDESGDSGQISEGANTDCSAAVDPTEPEPEPLVAPPVEIPTVLPQGQPLPCPVDDGGAMTVVPTDCPAPEPEQPAEPAPEPQAPPAPVVPQPPAAPPSTESDSADGNATGDDDPKPEVLGVQVERLPQTPAAPAVTATPTYNG